MRLVRGGRGAVVVLAALALAAGCTSAAPEPEGGAPTTLPAQTAPVPTSASDPASDPALARFYDQEVDWVPCGEVLQCTAVTVPVDWSAPEGPTLQVAVSKVPATDPDRRLGSLVVNPGGPGASGVDFVGEDGAQAASEDVRERYDVVGFDPRGVGRSDPVDCVSDAELDTYLAEDVDTSTPAGRAEAEQRARAFAAGCAADAGALLGHVDTPSVARDMDVLRAVLGEERLDYLGKSYGTLLGAEYARQLPQRVGRVVLDGALDPASSAADVTVGQARGLESSLRAFVTACLAGEVPDCPLEGAGDVGDDPPDAAVDAGTAQVADLLRQTAEQPLPTADPARDLTQPLAATGVVTPLYDEALWPTLATALDVAFSGDGTALLALADAYAGRRPDGSYASNLLEAFTAVNCLDYPDDPDATADDALARRLLEAAPTFAETLVGDDLTCDVWPVPAVRTPAPVTAEGSAPILVVGTTGDPATPYEWAQALADELSAGTLLTYDGEGHTAYLRGSSCVDGAIDAYLLDGVLPGNDATCRS